MDDNIKKPLLRENVPGEESYNSTGYGGVSEVNYIPQIQIPSGQEIRVETQYPIAVYKRRWYILVIYGLLAAVQGGYWNTWGPIAASSYTAFNWTSGDIALLSNWGPISYIIGAIPFSWLVDVHGLRWACVSSALLVAVGSGLRCLSDQPPAVSWLVHAGQFLNGMAGPVAMGVPPALSAVWFPPHQRTTSTAIAAIFNGLGVGISFIIGPMVVTDGDLTKNTSYSTSDSYDLIDGVSNYTTVVSKTRHEIMTLMYGECGFAVLVFLLILLYFPSRPPLPPSITASVERMEYKEGLFGLLCHYQFWLICVTYGVSLGVYNCWMSVLDVNLSPYGISETEAGWMGFYSTIAGSVSGLILARSADIFSRHMKWFLIAVYVAATACLVCFVLLLKGILPFSTGSLYATVILSGFLLSAAVPLYFEMSCEVTYPIAEGVTNFVLTLVNNIGGLIFLGVQMIPNIGTSWENWAVLGSVAFCIPVLLLFQERYNRLDVDETVLS